MESFFTIANHRLTIVEVDGEYTKPFTTECVMLVPGQTMNVLVTADQPIGRYSIAMGPYESIFNDNIVVKTVMDGLRSLNAVDVPKEIDSHLFITIGIDVNKCNSENPNNKCQGPRQGRLAASMNNISFIEPKVSIYLRSLFTSNCWKDTSLSLSIMILSMGHPMTRRLQTGPEQ